MTDVPADAVAPVGDGRRPWRGRRGLRRVVGALALVLLAGALYYAVTLLQVWRTGLADERAEVDAVVVLGAAQYDGRPSPQLAARLDHVVELYQAGRAPLIVTTGGKRAGDRFTEAEASAAYLQDRGVPADIILEETTGHSTWQSLSGVAAILRERGMDTVLLVSDPYHMLRSRLIAEEAGLRAFVSATRTSPVRGRTALGRHLVEAGGVAVGRLVGFDRL